MLLPAQDKHGRHCPCMNWNLLDCPQAPPACYHLVQMFTSRWSVFFACALCDPDAYLSITDSSPAWILSISSYSSPGVYDFWDKFSGCSDLALEHLLCGSIESSFFPNSGIGSAVFSSLAQLPISQNRLSCVMAEANAAWIYSQHPAVCLGSSQLWHGSKVQIWFPEHGR